MRMFRLLVAASLAGSATSALSQDGRVLAARFGALESVQSVSLSPDGSRISFVAPTADGGSKLMVADLTAGAAPRAILAQRADGQYLHGCRWATNDRLVCRTSTIVNYGGYLIPFNRLFAVDGDGSNATELTASASGRAMDVVTHGGSVIDWDLPEKPSRILITRQFVPQDTAGTNIRTKGEGLGIEEVDVFSKARSIVERPKTDAVGYISDGNGTVRIMVMQPMTLAGVLPQLTFQFRKPGTREWDPLSKQVMGDAGLVTGFSPEAVDAATNLAYGFDENNGFKALYTMSLDGTYDKKLVLARNDVDVDDLVQIGRNRRVVGASYATERRHIEYFDPALKKLAASLGKALPGNPDIWIVDASEDENKLLLFAYSDVDPGTFYRYDKTARKLEPILPMRGELAGIAMGQMKPVTFPAADGTLIPGYLTLPPGSTGKNLPAIVMPHGGPEARDEWGFDWLVQYFVARGFAVLQPNFRGSAGYGTAWFQKNGYQSWRVAVGDVNDAGRWLVSQGIADKSKLGIIGWSYGGYAALQSNVLDPELFKAVVAIAPVTDLAKMRDNPELSGGDRIMKLRYGQGPHITEGSPAQNAAAFRAPVLLFHGDKDRNVDIEQSKFMVDRLKGAGKQVELVTFPGLDHGLPNSAARTRMLADSDAFLRRSMGMPAN